MEPVVGCVVQCHEKSLPVKKGTEGVDLWTACAERIYRTGSGDRSQFVREIGPMVTDVEYQEIIYESDECSPPVRDDCKTDEWREDLLYKDLKTEPNAMCWLWTEYIGNNQLEVLIREKNMTTICWLIIACKKCKAAEERRSARYNLGIFSSPGFGSPRTSLRSWPLRAITVHLLQMVHLQSSTQWSSIARYISSPRIRTPFYRRVLIGETSNKWMP